VELIKNLKRTLEDADEKITQIEGLNEALLRQNKETTEEVTRLRRRNMELQTALCRCRDMIEQLKNAGSPNELEHDAGIYLGILEGLITEQVIRPFADPAEHMNKLYIQQKELEEGKKRLSKESKETESLRMALICLIHYWDKWKDAPDDHPTALSLEEVVNIARETLYGGEE